MGRRGPKPDPASVKEAKGNSARRPIGKDPVEQSGQAVGKIAPPPWLDGEALEIWGRMAPMLKARKLLSAPDVDTFGRYCRNYARWLTMQKTMDEEGETYESESAHGKLKRAHPAFMISDRLERMMLTVEDRFGLNPAERQRMFAARASQPLPTDLFGDTADKTEAPATGKEPTHKAPNSPIGLLQ